MQVTARIRLRKTVMAGFRGRVYRDLVINGTWNFACSRFNLLFLVRFHLSVNSQSLSLLLTIRLWIDGWIEIFEISTKN